jgi:hypothetical protein
MGTPFGELMAKYESLRPQLADAALAYLAEREGIDTIFTLDRRDFPCTAVAASTDFTSFRNWLSDWRPRQTVRY